MLWGVSVIIRSKKKCTMSSDSAAKLPETEVQLCLLAAVQLWTCHLAFLCLFSHL